MDNKRISDVVFNKIKAKIISGEWTSGMKIMSEPQLVKELGISRVSVREAIEKMVALNVLTKKHGGGTFVSELNASVYLNSLIALLFYTPEHEIMTPLSFLQLLNCTYLHIHLLE